MRIGLKNNRTDFLIEDMTWIAFSFSWSEKIPRGLDEYKYHLDHWRFESIIIPNGVDPTISTSAMGKWSLLANSAINFGEEPEYDPQRHFPHRLIVTKDGLKLHGRRLSWGPGSGLRGLVWDDDASVPSG